MIAYVTGSLAAHPVQLAAVDLPRRIRLAGMDDTEAVAYLMGRLPNLSEHEYRRLVSLTGRQFAPAVQAGREAPAARRKARAGDTSRAGLAALGQR